MANLSNINGKFVVEQTTGYVGVGTTDPNYPIEVLNASAEIALNASGGSIYRLRSTSGDSFMITKNGVGDRLVIDGSGNSTFGGNIDLINNKDISMTDNAGAITRVMVLNASNTMYIGPVDTYAGGSILYGSAAGVSYQRWYTGAVERMRIMPSGNVGIGTTSPSSKIDVREDANNVYTGYFYNSSTLANAHGINVQTATTNAGAYAFRVNSGSNTNALVVKGDANVGIGEDAPGTLLSLKSPLANTSIVTLKCSKNDSSWTIGDRIGGINFFGEDGSGQGAGIKGSINYVVESSSGGSNAMTFNVAGTANNQERMRINANGNVGIGTNVASDINEGKLCVNGTLVLDQTSEIKYGKNNGGPYLNIRSKDGSTSACGIRIHSAVGSPGYFYGEGSGTTGTIAILDGAGQGVFSATQGVSTSLGVNNSTRLFINNSGNVGIGETSVDARLHISALASNGISNVKLESPGASKWAFGIPAGQTYFALDDVNDNLTTPRLVVLKTSGNVGIGTDSPEDKLEVSGGALKIKASANHVEESYIKFGRIDQADGSYENHIKSVTGSGASQCKVTFSVCDTSATGRTNLLTLDGGNSRSIFQGNVGIGVTPTQKLDVDGLVKHKGLDMTTGIQVDQIATFNQTLTCLANTWTDTGVEGSDISSGHYMIGCYSNYYTSSPNWYNMYWTGTMAWYGGSSNGSFASDIFLNRVGHSDNGRTLELRTLIDYASIPKLQFKLNVSATNFTIRFIVRKLIS